MNISDEQIERIVRFYVSWVFLQFAHIPIFGRGATCPPYDLKSQKGQIEGIIRFYAASATCQGDKLKWTPTCQGTNCGARMFPGFLLNLSLFLSLAGGATWVGPLRHAFGMTPPPKGEARLGSPFGGAVAVRRLRGQPASASTQPMRGGRWQLALSVLANASPPPPKGEARLGFLQASGGLPTWLSLRGRYVPVGRCPAAGLRCRVGR